MIDQLILFNPMLRVRIRIRSSSLAFFGAIAGSKRHPVGRSRASAHAYGRELERARSSEASCSIVSKSELELEI